MAHGGIGSQLHCDRRCGVQNTQTSNRVTEPVINPKARRASSGVRLWVAFSAARVPLAPLMLSW
eukprot:6862297-Prymnesium_polylepis.1